MKTASKLTLSCTQADKAYWNTAIMLVMASCILAGRPRYLNTGMDTGNG